MATFQITVVPSCIPDYALLCVVFWSILYLSAKSSLAQMKPRMTPLINFQKVQNFHRQAHMNRFVAYSEKNSELHIFSTILEHH